MSWKILACRPCAIALLCIGGVVAGAPQSTPKTEGLTAKLVRTGLYLISGEGGNSLLRLSANGFILVDGKLPGNYDAILAQVKQLSYSDQPIRVLINTDYRQEHTGTNAKFLEAGTQIVAHENVKGNLVAPTKTYDHDFTIKLGGVEAQLTHFGNAYTNGDSVVYFPNLKVVAVGDLFTLDAPNPDFPAGGSLLGWGPVLAEILKLDFDIVVPGTGPLATRANLESFKKKLDKLVTRTTGLIKAGVPQDQWMAQLKTEDLGWRFTRDQVDRF